MSSAGGTASVGRQGVRAVQVRPMDRVRRMLKWLLVAKGRDVTERIAARSCLVVAPHPDDETLGCGATIMRKVAAGTPVRVVIATDGRYSSHSKRLSPDRLAEIRQAEALEASRRLGLAPGDVTFLGFEDKRLQDHRDALTDRLAAIVEEFRPQEILTSCLLDHHPDHRAGSQAVRAVLQSGAVRCPVLEYPMGFWRTFPWQQRPASPLRMGWSFVSGSASALVRLRPQLVRTDGLLARKRDVLEAYESQLRNLTGEPGWWTLDQQFLAQFLGRYEVFLPVTA